MSDVANPLAASTPIDWTPPASNLEISAEAKSFATAAMLDGPNGTRAPTDAEQVQRLQQARDILGDRFWQEKAPPPPTPAERAVQDELQARGIRLNAQADEFTVAVPPGVPADTGDRIRGFVAGLEFSPAVGNHIAGRISHNLEHYGKLSESDRTAWQIQNQTQITQWAVSKNWDLPKVTADVQKLLGDRKVDKSVAAFAINDFDVFVRLANHVEHLKTVKR